MAIKSTWVTCCFCVSNYSHFEKAYLACFRYYNKLQFVIKNAFDLYQLPPQFVELNDDEYPPVKFEGLHIFHWSRYATVNLLCGWTIGCAVLYCYLFAYFSFIDLFDNNFQAFTNLYVAVQIHFPKKKVTLVWQNYWALKAMMCVLLQVAGNWWQNLDTPYMAPLTNCCGCYLVTRYNRMTAFTISWAYESIILLVDVPPIVSSGVIECNCFPFVGIVIDNINFL